MENRTSDLWLGLGIGSVIGALVYRFSRTSKAKKLKKKVCDAFHKISGQVEEMLDTAKEKYWIRVLPQPIKLQTKLSTQLKRQMTLKAKCIQQLLMQKNETDSSKPIKNTRVFLNKPKLLTKTFEL